MNGEYIRKLPPEELYRRALPFLEKADMPVESSGGEKILKILAIEQPRLKKLSEVGEKTSFYFKLPDFEPSLLLWKDMTGDEVKSSLDTSIELLHRLEALPEVADIEKVLMPAAAAMGDKGRLLWPLRAALTGLKASPGPFEVISILGRDEAVSRLKRARTLV